jgi:hypothetical protein
MTRVVALIVCACATPKVPVYVFGNTKLFKRLELPAWVEALSVALRTSIVLFWGRWGLPVPFQVHAETRTHHSPTTRTPPTHPHRHTDTQTHTHRRAHTESRHTLAMADSQVR